jgi:hypothetical protein
MADDEKEREVADKRFSTGWQPLENVWVDEPAMAQLRARALRIEAAAAAEEKPIATNERQNDE